MSNGSKASFKLVDLKLKFRLVEVDKKYLDLAKNVEFNTAPVYYPFCQTKIRTHLVTTGVSSFTWSNAIRGKIPDQIIIGFLDHEGYTLSLEKNPVDFQNFNINRICLKINGSSYPATPYTPDFDTGKYLVMYDDFLRGLGVSHENQSMGIQKQDFKEHKFFTIFGEYLYYNKNFLIVKRKK